jgi:hypothetical protein
MTPRVIIPNTAPVLDHITDAKAYGFIELFDISNSLKMNLKGEMHILELIVANAPTFTSRTNGSTIAYLSDKALEYDKTGTVTMCHSSGRKLHFL